MNSSIADKKTCESCQAPYDHEPLVAGGIDLLANINRCPPCSEKESENYERERRESAAKVEWAEKIPTGYRRTSDDHPDFKAQAPTYRLSLRWLQGEDIGGTPRLPFLGLIGESGLCKSRIMALLCKRIIWNGERVLWVNSSEFQWCAQNQFGSDRSLGEWLKRYQAAQTLVFDDIGSLKATEAVADSLYHLLEHRSSREMRTLWTSNETENEMLQGDKISNKSRLRNISRIIGYSNIINLSLPAKP